MNIGILKKIAFLFQIEADLSQFNNLTELEQWLIPFTSKFDRWEGVSAETVLSVCGSLNIDLQYAPAIWFIENCNRYRRLSYVELETSETGVIYKTKSDILVGVDQNGKGIYEEAEIEVVDSLHEVLKDMALSFCLLKIDACAVIPEHVTLLIDQYND